MRACSGADGPPLRVDWGLSIVKRWIVAEPLCTEVRTLRPYVATYRTADAFQYPENLIMKATKWILLSIAVTTLGACATAPPKPSSALNQEKAVEVVPKPAPLPSLPAVYTEKGVTVKINEVWQDSDGKILGVIGTAKNVTASDLRFCQIMLAFLDQSGVKVDAAKASTKSLKSAQIWHFQAALSAPSQALYSSITPDKVIAIPVKNPKADLASLK
jgi:hypothetical protein